MKHEEPLANNLYDHVQKKLELMWNELTTILNTEPFDEARYITLTQQYADEYAAHMSGTYINISSNHDNT